jgi:hypothetical protein
LVLVGGRMKVACVLNSVSCLSDDSVVVIHDFQRYYKHRLIRKYFDVMEQSKPFMEVDFDITVPEIAILKFKKEMMRVEEKDLMEARHDPG